VHAAPAASLPMHRQLQQHERAAWHEPLDSRRRAFRILPEPPSPPRQPRTSTSTPDTMHTQTRYQSRRNTSKEPLHRSIPPALGHEHFLAPTESSAAKAATSPAAPSNFRRVHAASVPGQASTSARTTLAAPAYSVLQDASAGAANGPPVPPESGLRRSRSFHEPVVPLGTKVRDSCSFGNPQGAPAMELCRSFSFNDFTQADSISTVNSDPRSCSQAAYVGGSATCASSLVLDGTETVADRVVGRTSLGASTAAPDTAHVGKDLSSWSGGTRGPQTASVLQSRRSQDGYVPHTLQNTSSSSDAEDCRRSRGGNSSSEGVLHGSNGNSVLWADTLRTQGGQRWTGHQGDAERPPGCGSAGSSAQGQAHSKTNPGAVAGPPATLSSMLSGGRADGQHSKSNGKACEDFDGDNGKEQSRIRRPLHALLAPVRNKTGHQEGGHSATVEAAAGCVTGSPTAGGADPHLPKRNCGTPPGLPRHLIVGSSGASEGLEWSHKRGNAAALVLEGLACAQPGIAAAEHAMVRVPCSTGEAQAATTWEPLGGNAKSTLSEVRLQGPRSLQSRVEARRQLRRAASAAGAWGDSLNGSPTPADSGHRAAQHIDSISDAADVADGATSASQTAWTGELCQSAMHQRSSPQHVAPDSEGYPPWMHSSHADGPSTAVDAMLCSGSPSRRGESRECWVANRGTVGGVHGTVKESGAYLQDRQPLQPRNFQQSNSRDAPQDNKPAWAAIARHNSGSSNVSGCMDVPMGFLTMASQDHNMIHGVSGLSEPRWSTPTAPHPTAAQESIHGKEVREAVAPLRSFQGPAAAAAVDRVAFRATLLQAREAAKRAVE
jgi:hypothetical protein